MNIRVSVGDRDVAITAGRCIRDKSHFFETQVRVGPCVKTLGRWPASKSNVMAAECAVDVAKTANAALGVDPLGYLQSLGFADLTP